MEIPVTTTKEEDIYSFGFGKDLSRGEPDDTLIGNSTDVKSSLDSGVNPITSSGEIQMGTVQASSGLAPFHVGYDPITGDYKSTYNIKRVGAVKFASATDLGVNTVNQAATVNKVIYASGNNLHINVPSSTDRIYLEHAGSGRLITGMKTETYANPLALTENLEDCRKITTTSAVGDATITVSNSGVGGKRLILIITNDATSGRTITFGTNFTANGTLVGTASKTAIVEFISDGTTFYEVARTTGLG